MIAEQWKRFLPLMSAVAVAVVLVGVGLLTTIVPLVLKPQGRVFSGIHGYSDDYVGYVSYIKEGMYGRSTMLIRSLPFRQPASPIHIIYIALGKIAGLVTDDAPLVYHVSRTVLAIVFVLLAHRLLRSLGFNTMLATLTTLLAFVSGSLGWVAYEGGAWVYRGLNFFPFSIVTPERVTDRPHYLAGAIIFLLLILFFVRKHRSFQIIIAASVLSFTLPIVHAPFAIIAVTTAVIYALLSIVATRSIRRHQFSFLLATGVPAGLGLLLIKWFLSQYEAAERIWINVYFYRESLTLISVFRDVLSFGPTLWIGLPGLVWAAVRSSNVLSAPSIMAVWLISQLSLFSILYPLFGAERVRFIQSLYFIPMAYGSVLFLKFLLKSRDHALVIAIFLLITISLPTYIHDELKVIKEVSNPAAYSILAFPTVAQRDAYRFLNAHTSRESTVLAWFESSNHILIWSHNRVIGNTQGWPVEEGTMMKHERDLIFSGKLSYGSARAILSKYRIDYIYYGYQERALGKIRHYPFLTQVFSNNEAIIYKVFNAEGKRGKIGTYVAANTAKRSSAVGQQLR